MKGEIKGTARGQVEARLLDLSLGGALLHLSAALPESGIHDFVLNLDGETVWVQGEVLRPLVAVVVDGFGGAYPELVENRAFIEHVLGSEPALPR